MLPLADEDYAHGAPHALRMLPKPDPPPWLRARVMAAIGAEEHRRSVRRVWLRRCFAVALLLQLAVFVDSERTGQ